MKKDETALDVADGAKPAPAALESNAAALEESPGRNADDRPPEAGRAGSERQVDTKKAGHRNVKVANDLTTGTRAL